VARLIDPGKAEQPTLTDLSMHHAIRSADINKPGLVVPRRIDLFGYNLTAEPIAVEVPV